MLGRIAITTLLVLLVIPAAAQDPGEDPRYAFYVFHIEPLTLEPVEVPYLGSAAAEFTFHDDSRDGTGVIPDDPLGVTFFHNTRFTAEIVAGDPTGWFVKPMTPQVTMAGDSVDMVVEVVADVLVREPAIAVQVTAITTTEMGTFQTNASFQFFTPGQQGFIARGGPSPGTLAPREVGTATLIVGNPGLYPQIVRFQVVDNPCNVRIAPPPATTLERRDLNHAVRFSVQAPEDQFLYITQNCGVTMKVTSDQQPGQEISLTVAVIVSGSYLDPGLIFTVLGVALLVFLLFLILARRKARIEEEILGRPQKPWTIPVEMVYLDHLKERDPQAHYVVRHYLMEEEYSSAMAWYREYKKATRGSRAKERLVVNQEHKYERFRARWNKRIAKPQKEVDRYAASLQKKLDRRGKKGLRKDRRKWKKLTKTMKAAHKKKQERVTKKWQRQAKRAQRKKQPEPPKPVLATPDYPPEPSKDKVDLAKHPWNAKVEKARRKAVKKQGNLEVKFEKEDAKVLRKVRKRVQKIARKLDDPDFAAEHPILAKDAKST